MMRKTVAFTRKAQIYALSIIGIGYDLHLKSEINQYDFHPTVEVRISSGGDDTFINELYHESVIRIRARTMEGLGG